jgi:hypothetical protein
MLRMLFYTAIAVCASAASTSASASHYVGYSACMPGQNWAGCVGPYAPGYWYGSVALFTYADCLAYKTMQAQLLGMRYPGGYCTTL